MKAKSRPTKAEYSIISAVTIGGFLEWYEMFLFGYWIPIIAHQFFQNFSHTTAIIHSLLVFAIGFFSRPVGGLIFGHIGDHFGRKTSFLLSIIAISVPSFAIALLPQPNVFGNFSIYFLIFLRFIQGIPAGGELPGAICYLRELATPSRRKFITSFAFVGPQIGSIVGMLEALVMGQFFSHEWLLQWGWRLSFFLGGSIGVLGFYWRKTLKESPAFIALKESHNILKTPIASSFNTHKKKMILGFCICMFEIVGYFLIATFPSIYFEEIVNSNTIGSLAIGVVILILSALTIPLFGKWSENRDTRKLLSLSALGVFILSIPLYIAVSKHHFMIGAILILACIPLLNFQFALIPSTLSDLFPTNMRYTCLGITFNFSDSLIGGLTPLIAFLMILKMNNPGACILLFTVSSAISLIAFQFIEKRE